MSLEDSITPSRSGKPKQVGRRLRLSQEAIIEVAAELFARNGFGATSLDDIAKALDATKGALYYHVKNKEEILRIIYLNVLSASEEPLRQIVESNLSPLEKLQKAIKHHSAVAADRSPAMTVFYRETPHLTGRFASEIVQRKKVYERYFEQIIEEGIQAGIFRNDLDHKIITFGILGMVNWLSQWYRPGGQYTPLEIATIFTNLLKDGLTLPGDFRAK